MKFNNVENGCVVTKSAPASCTLAFGVLTLVACSWSMGCFAQDCVKIEYAQYKDQARTRSGQRNMAFDHCSFTQRREIAQKMIDLANQYGMVRDAENARAAQSCMEANRSKIYDALTAAKATNTITFMLNGCKGTYKADR